MIPPWHSGIILYSLIIESDYPCHLAWSNDLLVLQSYQKPAVSEMSMISSYYQAYKCKVLIQIIHFEDHWKHAKLIYKFYTTCFTFGIKVSIYLLDVLYHLGLF